MASTLVPYHQNTFDLLGIEPPPRSEIALAKIAECERRCGRQLPASVREWFSYEGAAPRTEPFDRGGFNYGGSGFLWFDWTNDDHPTTLEALLASFAEIRGRRDARFVHVLGENQGNGGWVVEFDGSDDPPVWCTIDWGSEPVWEEAGEDVQGPAPSHGGDGSREHSTSGDDDEDEDPEDEDPEDKDPEDEDLEDEDLEDEPFEGRLEASRFSDFVFAHFHRSHSTHVQLGSYRRPGPRYDHGLWFRAPRAAAVGPEALAQISAVLGPPRVTRTSSGATSYRFLDGVQSGVHLVTEEPGTPGARASWWCWAKSGPSLVALFRQVVPLGKLERTARVETQQARKALAELLAAGALAPTRAPRPLAWHDEPSEHDAPAPEEVDDPWALDALVRSLQGGSSRAVGAAPSDDGEATRQLVALWNSATRPGPLVRALYKGGEDQALLRACVACARRAVALVDAPHAAKLDAALDLVERAVHGEIAAGELDALGEVLSRDPAPGPHRSHRAHDSVDQEWLQLDVRYVANHCTDAPLLLAQRAVVRTLAAAARVLRVETYSLDDLVSSAVDAIHHALLLADVNADAARAGQQLAEEIRRVAGPPPVAQVRASREREQARLHSARMRPSTR
jgi:hypothetical protein